MDSKRTFDIVVIGSDPASASAVLLPELKIEVRLSKLFYDNEMIRNFLMKRYGNKITEGMTQILMGDRTYPKNIVKQVKKKLKKAIFS